MIFVTVGAQMPFDRLIQTVDLWAAREGRDDVFAQVGDSDYSPVHIEAVQSLAPEAFTEKILSAQVIIGHAGMGTIISALQHGKPLLVMPRRGDLRETRNDHQVATAERFLEKGMVHVAMDESELEVKLSHIDQLSPTGSISSRASRELIDAIRSFI